MPTADEFAHITNKKLLGFVDFDVYLMKYLRKSVREATKRLFIQGSFEERMPLSSSGSNRVQVDLKPTIEDGIAHDGAGCLLDLEEIDTDTPFENVDGMTYEVGAAYVEYPRGIRINPRTGKPEYDHFVEGIGVQATPDEVFIGPSTITFRVDALFESGPFGVGNHSGREVRVFRVEPGDAGTTEVVAIEVCEVFSDADQNKITTTGYLGETTPTDQLDLYVVQLIGLTVLRETAENKPSLNSESVFFIGTVLGNGSTPTVFDITDQSVIQAQSADLVTVDPLPDWADSTDNPGGFVQEVFEQIIGDLTSTSGGRGAAKITAPALTSEQVSIAAQRLDQTLAAIFSIATQADMNAALEAVRRVKLSLIRGSSTPIVETASAVGIAIRPDTGVIVVVSEDDGEETGIVNYGGNILPELSGWATGPLVGGFLGPVSGILWDGSQFIVFGGEIQTSPDGSAWTSQVSGEVYWSAALGAFGIVVAISSTGFARLSAGLWHVTSGGAAFTGSVQNVVVFDEAHGVFVACLSNGATLYSTDGSVGSWFSAGAHGITGGTSLSATYYQRLGAVVIAGYDGTDYVVRYSFDGGMTWETSITLSGAAKRNVFSAGSCLVLSDEDVPGYMRVAANIKSETDWTLVRLPDEISPNPNASKSRYAVAYLYAEAFGMSAIAFVGGNDVYLSALMGDVLPPSPTGG